VLTAMGIPAEVAQTAVRFSFDSSVTAEDLAAGAAAVGSAVTSVRALGAG
jgi:cysteine desulfurase